MKKIYTKPSLHAEKFAVEDIMTTETILSANAVKAVFLDGEQFTGFTKFNDVYSIKYTEFNPKAAE